MIFLCQHFCLSHKAMHMMLLHFLLHYILHSCCCSSCFISVFCKFIASPLSVHHSLMFVLFCFVLLCSAPLHPPFCLPMACLYLGPCVFSCACPSPSRSEHRGAHSDPPGGETSEDQSSAQARGRQRYGSRRWSKYLWAV